MADAHLFKPEDGIRSASGARIAYLLKKPAQKLTIEVLDSKGQVVRTFTGSPPAAAGGGRGGGGRGGGGGEAGEGESGGQGGGGRGGFGGQVNPPMTAGLHSVTWDLRYPSATSFPGMVLWGGGVTGPAAMPGNYQVRLTADGKTQMLPLVVKWHPLISVSANDLQEQFVLASQIRDKLSEANNAVIQIRKLKEQAADRVKKSNDNAQLKAAAETLSKNLSAIEQEIYQVRNQSNQDPLNFPIKINNRLAALLSMVNRGDGKPIGNALPVFNDLKAELKVQTDRLARALSADLAAFNAEAKRLNLEAVSEK